MRRAVSRRGRKTRQRTVIPTKDKPSYLPWPMCAASILFAKPPHSLCAFLSCAHRTPWPGFMYTHCTSLRTVPYVLRRACTST